MNGGTCVGVSMRRFDAVMDCVVQKMVEKTSVYDKLETPDYSMEDFTVDVKDLVEFNRRKTLENLGKMCTKGESGFCQQQSNKIHFLMQEGFMEWDNVKKCEALESLGCCANQFTHLVEDGCVNANLGDDCADMGEKDFRLNFFVYQSSKKVQPTENSTVDMFDATEHAKILKHVKRNIKGTKLFAKFPVNQVVPKFDNKYKALLTTALDKRIKYIRKVWDLHTEISETDVPSIVGVTVHASSETDLNNLRRLLNTEAGEITTDFKISKDSSNNLKLEELDASPSADTDVLTLEVITDNEAGIGIVQEQNSYNVEECAGKTEIFCDASLSSSTQCVEGTCYDAPEAAVAAVVMKEAEIVVSETE